MKKRVILRTIINGYLTEPENERALFIGLQIIHALVRSENRHYRNYSRCEGKGWVQEKESGNEILLEKVIGTELMKLALELNLFLRLMTTI